MKKSMMFTKGEKGVFLGMGGTFSSFVRTLAVIASLASLFTLCSCSKKQEAVDIKEKNIAVFVPGVVSGSPVYEMFVSGVTKAAQEATAAGTKVQVQVLEAGTKQSDWEIRLTSIAAEQKYDLILSSNPALPEIAESVSAQFPNQAFLILDSWHTGNPQIRTVRYNQREQAYLSGYMAALVSSSSMKYANSTKKIGLIAGQEYPAMNDIILPAFLEGARAVDPAFEVDFRVVGNWFDASRGAELARAMFDSGVDVIMPISGGANQGVISAARDKGAYIAWFDDNGYVKAPGFVISSSIMAQEKLAHEQTKAWIQEGLSSEEARTVGIAEGYISFVLDDPLFIEHVPSELRAKQAALLDKLRSGELKLPVQ